MNKPVRKTLPLSSLIVDLKVNVRNERNYDLAPLIQQVRDAGRIIKPIVVEERPDQGYLVLQGNRRTQTAQALVSDPSCSPELKEALSKLECIVYSGLSDRERTVLIVDHGGEKPLCQTEVVETVWRLNAEGLSESEIGNLLYQSLAKFTGNERKLHSLPVDPEKRKKAISTWFRGTLGTWILRAPQLGHFVKRQFLLTFKRQDNLLETDPDTGEPERLEMKVTRERMQALFDAMQADKKAGASGWTPHNGGESFNQLVELYKDQDAGRTALPAKVVRPNVTDLIQKQGLYDSALARKVFGYCAGEEESAYKGMKDLDERAARWEKVEKVLLASEASDPTLKEFLTLVLHGNPADIRKFLKSMSPTNGVALAS